MLMPAKLSGAWKPGGLTDTKLVNLYNWQLCLGWEIAQVLRTVGVAHKVVSFLLENV